MEKAKEFVAGIIKGDPKYLTGDFSRQCQDGSIGFHTFSANPVIKNGVVIGIEGFIIDSTERKLAEEKIKTSLKEKETLLQEIHHRVKNNMAVVSSLLKLQAYSIDDDRIKKALQESQSRVDAMSAIHETLYSSEDLSEIDLKSYLFKISNTLFQTYAVNTGKVTLNTESDETRISMEKANPVGLIVNELISNSLKYAFPDERKGVINVKLKKQDKELKLIIMDDGIGMPDGLDWKGSKTLGLKLVILLVENQLNGSIHLENKNGTEFTIKFNTDEA